MYLGTTPDLIGVNHLAKHIADSKLNRQIGLTTDKDMGKA